MSGHVQENLNRIIKLEEYPYPKNLALACAWIAGNFKGEGLKILDVSERSSLADYFVIATAQNHIQLSSMSHALKKSLREAGFESVSAEGEETGWYLLDFGDVIAHLFLPTERELYDLEGLWKDAPRIEIPQDYYYSTPGSGTASSTGSAGDYF